MRPGGSLPCPQAKIPETITRKAGAAQGSGQPVLHARLVGQIQEAAGFVLGDDFAGLHMGLQALNDVRDGRGGVFGGDALLREYVPSLVIPQRGRLVADEAADDLAADALRQLAGLPVTERRRVGLADVPQLDEVLVGVAVQTVAVDLERD